MHRKTPFYLLIIFLLLITSGSARRPEVTQFSPLYMVEDKESYQITCNLVKGTKPILFEWFKNGRKLTSGSVTGLVIDNKPSSSSLTFQEFSTGSAGNYSCRTQNRDGSDQTFTILQIKGLSENILHFPLVMWR